MSFLETKVMPAIDQLSRTHRKLAVELCQRVAYGAEWLDQVESGWFRRIALDKLAMASCDDCIMGQLYGNFEKGVWLISRPLPTTFLFSAAAHRLTLFDHEQEYENDYEHAQADLRFAALADAWRFQVRQRLEREGGDDGG